MAKSKDVLAGSVSFHLQVGNLKLSVGGKSRALVAFDRLVGNAFDVPGAIIEQFRDRLREPKGAGPRIGNSGMLGRSAPTPPAEPNGPATLFVKDVVRKQENKRAIAEIALRELPARIEATDGESESDDTASVNEDWMNRFTAIAEDISSGELRSIFGRILAGEIVRPGAFSLTTLRIVSEMDRKIAEAFETQIRYRLPSDYVVGADVLRRVTWPLLEYAGLLQGFVFGVQPITHENGGGTYWWEGFYGLRFYPRGELFTLPCVKLSRSGIELASLFPRPDVRRTLCHLSTLVEGECSRIELCKAGHKLPNNLVSYLALNIFPHPTFDWSPEAADFSAFPD